MSDGKSSDGHGKGGDKGAKPAGDGKSFAGKAAGRPVEDAKVIGESKGADAAKPAPGVKPAGATVRSSATGSTGKPGENKGAKPGASDPAGRPRIAPSPKTTEGAGQGGGGGGSGGGMTAGIAGFGGAVIGALLTAVGLGAFDQQPDYMTRAAATSAISQAEQTAADAAATAIDRVAALQSDLERVSAALAEETAARQALEEAHAETATSLASARNRTSALVKDVSDRDANRGKELTTVREQVANLAATLAAAPTLSEGGEGGPADAAATARISLFEGALRRLEARVNGMTAETLPTPDLTRIDTLEGQMAGYAALETRIQELEATRLSVDDSASLGVAFGALSQAVAGSQPYEVELATLETVADITVDPALGDPAAGGLVSDISLATRFDSASRAALTAIQRQEAAEDDSMWTGALSSLVVIRRTTEDTEGGAPDQVLSRAEARIDEGDVSAALAEIDTLPQAGRDAMSAWLTDARARAGAEAALAELRGRLLGAPTAE